MRVLWITALLVSLTAIAVPAHTQVVLERGKDGSVTITNHKRGTVTRSGNRLARTSAVSEGVQVLELQPSRGASPRRSPATPEVEDWVSTWSTQANLDQQLVLSVIAAESNFDPDARSKKGAIGLMQLMPGTAKDMGIDDPWDPESNIKGGTRYLRQMLDRFGQNLELALAAYNAGPGAVEANGGVPPYRETRNYVRRVLSRYRGAPIELGGLRLSPSKQVRYRAIETRRDANGHLVILTP